MRSVRNWWAGVPDKHPNVNRILALASRLLPSLNYITIHYTYFTIGCLLSSLVFWGSSDPFGKISYVDSLFMVTSAFTNTGLNTVNVSEMTTWQQVLLWLLMIVGSPIWVSIWTVLVRKNAFERRFKDIVAVEKDMKKRQASLRRAPALQNMLRIRKLNTEPSSLPTTAPGLGSKPPTSDNIDIDADPPGIGSRLRRLRSAPHASAPSLDYERTIIADHGVDGIPDPVTDNELVELHQRPASRTQTNALGGLMLPVRRASSESNGSSSVDLEDILFHWEKILGKHNVSHNGQFYNLTSEQREQIGGTEYRALKILALTVPMYFILWQLLGAIALGAWMAAYAQYRSELMQVQPWWAGIFLSISAFNNGGLSVFNDSLVSFGRSYFVLIVTALLILAGNTAYPILLRFIFWSILKLLNTLSSPKAYGPWKETLQFILKYPRRVYTTLFPRRATWWLTIVLIVINSIDWVCFEVLNIGNPKVEAYGVGQSIMDGWFQSISVRAAGLVVFPLSNLYIAMQVVYLIMMYISVYPVVITMRTSNVYEERSLGIYNDDKSLATEPEVPSADNNGGNENPWIAPSATEPNKGQFLRRRMTKAAIGNSMSRAITFHGVGVQAPSKDGEENSRVNFISQQIRGQLAHDLWWLALAVLVIVLIETSHFMADPVTFSVFNVLFESVSAYGCVGLSIGIPNQDYSFAGGWYVGSKLVLCLVMLRGRHRGLPVAVDRAVRLPGEKLHEEEEEDSRIRRTMSARRRSMEI